MRVVAGGQLQGDSAVSALSAMTAGTYFIQNNTPGGNIYVKVTVTGQSPPSGKVWALRLSDAAVVLFDDTIKPAIQYVGTFDHMTLATTVQKTGIAVASDTLGDLSQGGILDTGSPDGDAGIKVVVKDVDNNAVSPGANNSWRYLFKNTAVVATADSSTVESYGESAIDTIFVTV